MQDLTPGQAILIAVHNSETNQTTWQPGTFQSYVSATDREYRMNVKLQNGWEIAGAAPECVKLPE